MLYKIGRADDIPPGQMRQHSIGESEILIVNAEGRFFALAARCTHAGAPLVEGSLEGQVLTCPWHGSRFNVADGSVLKGPADEALKVYPVSLDGGVVSIQI